MNKRILISLIAGTIILFLWNAASWMVFPFHSNTLKNIPDNAIQTELLRKEMPESGVYHYPGLPTNNSTNQMNKIEAKLKEGPRITMMVYKNEPTELFEPKTFLFSLLINLLTVIGVFFLISKIGISNPKTIFISTLMIGIVAAIVSDISLMNWYMLPIEYTLVNTFDKIISFGLLGVLFSFYTFKNFKNA